jgi:preprotein translocase subunit SecA
VRAWGEDGDVAPLAAGPLAAFAEACADRAKPAASAAGGGDALASPALRAAEAARNVGDVSGRGKIGRNDPCFCGSGRKYKHCHGSLA